MVLKKKAGEDPVDVADGLARQAWIQRDVQVSKALLQLFQQRCDSVAETAGRICADRV